jgi:hypothetical protein
MSDQIAPAIMLLLLSAFGAYLLLFARQYRDWMVRRLQLPRTVPIYRVIGGMIMVGTLFILVKIVFHDL